MLQKTIYVEPDTWNKVQEFCREDKRRLKDGVSMLLDKGYAAWKAEGGKNENI